MILKVSVVAELRRYAAICVAVGGVVALTLVAPRGAGAQARSAEGIRVVVKKLRNDHGRLGCGLYNGSDGFPDHEYRGTNGPIKGGVGTCEFKDVPAGTYAVTVLHDENENGKMDFNWIGMPTKGYGFSNDAKAFLSAPSFQAASFNYSGVGMMTVPITIVYR